MMTSGRDTASFVAFAAHRFDQHGQMQLPRPDTLTCRRLGFLDAQRDVVQRFAQQRSRIWRLVRTAAARIFCRRTASC
jgi:uncharacterized protein YcgI (DUF1989 family)